jgi:thioesterase domain-containing protein
LELSCLLNNLKQLDVVLSKEGDRLQVTAPAGAITQEIADAIRQHKPDLLAILGEVTDRSIASVSVERVEDRTSYPLSPSQERNLFPAQNGPGLAIAYIIKGPLDPERLRTVLDHIVSRHATLRTTISIDGNESKAQVGSQEEAQLEIWDLSEEGLEVKESEWRGSELRKRLIEVSSRPFILDKGPLYRFQLCKVNDETHVLAFIVSQLVFDGTSFDLFLKELSEGYSALTQGAPLPFAPLEIEYMDYVGWKRRLLAERGPALVAWWKEALGTTVPDSPIPLDHPRPSVPAYKGVRVPLMIPPDFADSIRKLAKEQGVTTQIILLSAAFILINRLSGRSDCHIAIPIDGRRYPPFEPLIGSFVNLVLLRVELNQGTPYNAFLPELRDYCMTAFDNQDIPIESLGLRIERKGTNSRAPLFQLEFSYQHVSQRNTMMGPLSLAQVDIHGGGTANELSLWVRDWGHKIDGAFEFSTALFERETIDHWLGCYLGILRYVVEHPDAALGTIDLLAEEGGRVASILDKSLHALPGRKTILKGQDGKNLRLLDSEGRPAPLGAWANLVSGDKVLIENIRLKADGAWVSSEFVDGTSAARKAQDGLRTRVYDNVEFQVIESFCSTLHLRNVGLQDNFFELGGHSLLALTLVSHLQKEFGLRLALSVLFEAPTPFALAKIVRRECRIPDPETGVCDEGGAAEWTTVVPIHAKGTLPPIFVAAGSGGNPLNLRFISKYLGTDQPFYGLQHRGTDGRRAPHKRIEDMAKEYADDIQRVQASGPYYLGGFSAGGIHVFEAARELINRGEQIGTIIMFEAMSPFAVASRDSSLEKIKGRLKADIMRTLLLGIRRRAKTLWNGITIRVGAKLALIDPFRFRNQALLAAGAEAYRHYRPTPLKVEVLVLRSKIRDMGIDDETNGWGPLVQGTLKIIEVEGGHVSHIEDPFVEQNMRILSEELANTRKRLSIEAGRE